MEQWRRELYHSELYHYGVKGMKWGKHLKSNLDDLWNKRLTGKDYRNLAAQHYWDYTVNQQRSRADRTYAQNTKQMVGGKPMGNLISGEYAKAKTNAHNENMQARKSENRAARMVKAYRTKSLRGIANSQIAHATKWIKSKINKKTDLHAVRPRNDGTIPETIIKEKYVREKYS